LGGVVEGGGGDAATQGDEGGVAAGRAGDGAAAAGGAGAAAGRGGDGRQGGLIVSIKVSNWG